MIYGCDLLWIGKDHEICNEIVYGYTLDFHIVFGWHNTCEVLVHVFVYHITLGERMIEEDILQCVPVSYT